MFATLLTTNFKSLLRWGHAAPPLVTLLVRELVTALLIVECRFVKWGHVNPRPFHILLTMSAFRAGDSNKDAP